MGERRDAARHARELEVELHVRKERRRVRTGDVSRHGLLILCDDPPPVSHAVLLSVRLGGGTFDAMATVARHVERRHDQLGGAGLRFFCLGAAARKRWDEFIGTVERPTLRARPRPGVSGACFLIQPSDAAALLEFYEKIVLARSVVFVTPALRQVGAPVRIVLVHPVTHEELAFDGEVASWSADDPLRMGVRMRTVDKEARAAFRAFLGPTAGVGSVSMPEGAPLIPTARDRVTEYAFVSPKLRKERGVAEPLDVVEGKLLDLPELQLVDKSELFDFDWQNDDTVP
ncbi:MAG: PilZ domain-containing protein [Deltaproteobacteria bacterium]|nr:PilZ domain-containing protein [Deltaproteobacteria bacterium]